MNSSFRWRVHSARIHRRFLQSKDTQSWRAATRSAWLGPHGGLWLAASERRLSQAQCALQHGTPVLEDRVIRGVAAAQNRICGRLLSSRASPCFKQSLVNIETAILTPKSDLFPMNRNFC